MPVGPTGGEAERVPQVHACARTRTKPGLSADPSPQGLSSSWPPSPSPSRPCLQVPHSQQCPLAPRPRAPVANRPSSMLARVTRWQRILIVPCAGPTGTQGSHRSSTPPHRDTAQGPHHPGKSLHVGSSEKLGQTELLRCRRGQTDVHPSACLHRTGSFSPPLPLFSHACSSPNRCVPSLSPLSLPPPNILQQVLRGPQALLPVAHGEPCGPGNAPRLWGDPESLRADSWGWDLSQN